MTQEEFNIVFELQMRKCADILAHKKKEYTGDNIDRLSACLLYTSFYVLISSYPFLFLQSLLAASPHFYFGQKF